MYPSSCSLQLLLHTQQRFEDNPSRVVSTALKAFQYNLLSQKGLFQTNLHPYLSKYKESLVQKMIDLLDVSNDSQCHSSF